MLGTLFAVLAVALTSAPANSLTSEGPKVSVITDFGGNHFTLLEGQNCYEIHDSKGAFIEGSYSTNSPYYLLEGDKCYLGPGNYYSINGDVVTDILANEEHSLDEYEGCSYIIPPIEKTRKNSSVPNSGNTYIDSNGFTVINEAEYFKNLSYFPQNWDGECGLIALSILLGYYDTFYNDDFIPNGLTHDGKYTVPSSSGGSEFRTRVEPLLQTTETPYREGNYYPFDEWETMPGTNYAMRDYLIDKKYMTVFWGGVFSGGHPMADGELYETLQKYMMDNCPELIADTEFRHDSVLFTHEKAREYINQGLPTALVILDYEYTRSVVNGENKPHVVVAFGYKDDTFLTHFGWNPHSTMDAEVILSSATIYGYFAIKYNGEHKHSSNVYMKNGNVTKYICGCGAVHEAHHHISPNEWGFDARYYFENEGLKTNTVNIGDLSIQTERLRCGYIENQYINLSPDRVGAGEAYLDLTFNEDIYQMNTNLSFWSNNERLLLLYGDSAYIKYVDASGTWQTALDILSSNLSDDRTAQDYHELLFPNGTRRIRIEAHKNYPTSDRNKGRICIGETSFVTKVNQS